VEELDGKVVSPIKPMQGTETNLLVEDEDVRSMVRGMSYIVLEASRGTEALRLARRFSGPVTS